MSQNLRDHYHECDEICISQDFFRDPSISLAAKIVFLSIHDIGEFPINVKALDLIKFKDIFDVEYFFNGLCELNSLDFIVFDGDTIDLNEFKRIIFRK